MLLKVHSHCICMVLIRAFSCIFLSVFRKHLYTVFRGQEIFILFLTYRQGVLPAGEGGEAQQLHRAPDPPPPREGPRAWLQAHRRLRGEEGGGEAGQGAGAER